MPTTPPPPKRGRPLRHLRASDLRVAAQLATHATVGVTRMVEGVHRSVLGTIGAPGAAERGRTAGITGMVYRSIIGAAQLLGQGTDLALARLQPMLETLEADTADTPRRLGALAALNGVMGDRLATLASPLAIRMALCQRGQVLASGALDSALAGRTRMLLMVHGLCMNDLHWQGLQSGRPCDHGAELAAALDAAPLYLRYNTGRHVSDNGRELSALLEQTLLTGSGAGVQGLTVVAHSMGGLVLRAALLHAGQEGRRWPQRLRQIVFLGTPLHGAPLERAGNWVDTLLEATPWSAPLARLGQLRSAGITDLRYGFVAEADWQGRERFRRQPDRRLHLPLPEGVACFALAATLAARRGLLADRLVGDGLVPLRSALGRHDDPQRTLAFAPDNQWIAYRTHHLELLRSPEVAAQLVRWLA